MRLKTVLYLILMLVILINPAKTFQYASQGLIQWGTKMVPTLFPFMMISSIMIYSEADTELGSALSHILKRFYHYSKYGLYAIFIGFLCGFPMGAKVVCELYENNKINKTEALSLLGFCNNIGPAYFLGIILPMLGECGYQNKLPFLFGMYGIPAVYGFFLSLQYHSQSRHNVNKPIPPNDNSVENSISLKGFSSILKKSCLDNTQSLILLGGYITFINSLRILTDYLPCTQNTNSILSAFLEIMNGVQSIYLTTLSGNIKMFWILTALCFGGLSCILQTSCFLEKAGLSTTSYIKHKLLITIISGIYYFYILIYNSF